MGIIGGRIGYYILKRISKDGESGYMDGSVYANKSKLETLLGSQFWREIENKTVVDFGCGAGAEAVEIAERGASKVRHHQQSRWLGECDHLKGGRT